MSNGSRATRPPTQFSRVTHRYDMFGVADSTTAPVVILWPSRTPVTDNGTTASDAGDVDTNTPSKDDAQRQPACSWGLFFGSRDTVYVVAPEARTGPQGTPRESMTEQFNMPLYHEMDGFQPAVVTAVEALIDPGSPGVSLATPARAWVLVGTSIGVVFLLDLKVPAVIARFTAEQSVLERVTSARQDDQQELLRVHKTMEISAIHAIAATTKFLTVSGNGVVHMWDWTFSHQLTRVTSDTPRDFLAPLPGAPASAQPTGPLPSRVVEVDADLDDDHVVAGTVYNAAPVLTLIDTAGHGVSAIFCGTRDSPIPASDNSAEDSVNGTDQPVASPPDPEADTAPDAVVLVGKRNSSISLFTIPQEAGRCATLWRDLPAIPYGSVLACSWLAEGLVAVGGEDDRITLLHAAEAPASPHASRPTVTSVSLAAHNSYVTDIARLPTTGKPNRLVLASAGLDGRVVGWVAPTASYCPQEWFQKEMWTTCTLLRRPTEIVRSIVNLPSLPHSESGRRGCHRRRSLIVSSVSKTENYIIRKVDIIDELH